MTCNLEGGIHTCLKGISIDNHSQDVWDRNKRKQGERRSRLHTSSSDFVLWQQSLRPRPAKSRPRARGAQTGKLPPVVVRLKFHISHGRVWRSHSSSHQTQKKEQSLNWQTRRRSWSSRRPHGPAPGSAHPQPLSPPGSQDTLPETARCRKSFSIFWEGNISALNMRGALTLSFYREASQSLNSKQGGRRATAQIPKTSLGMRRRRPQFSGRQYGQTGNAPGGGAERARPRPHTRPLTGPAHTSPSFRAPPLPLSRFPVDPEADFPDRGSRFLEWVSVFLLQTCSLVPVLRPPRVRAPAAVTTPASPCRRRGERRLVRRRSAAGSGSESVSGKIARSPVHALTFLPAILSSSPLPTPRRVPSPREVDSRALEGSAGAPAVPRLWDLGDPSLLLSPPPCPPVTRRPALLLSWPPLCSHLLRDDPEPRAGGVHPPCPVTPVFLCPQSHPTHPVDLLLFLFTLSLGL